MKKFFFVLCCGIVLGIVLSLLSAEMIKRTADKEFCSSCHSMKTVAQAYTEDVHGGKNDLGFKAKCVDCHLPHDNVFHYVTAKIASGTKDVLGELFWAKSFDWIANLKHKEEFTYSSGCLECHDLKAMQYKIPKAFPAHKDFLMGKVSSCVKCHENVGHKNIRDAFIR